MTQNNNSRQALLRRILTTTLAPALAFGLVGAGTAAASAAGAPAPASASKGADFGTWGAPRALTDGSTRETPTALKTAKDGTVVALWERTAKDNSKQEVVVEVRPAGGTNWLPIQTLAASNPQSPTLHPHQLLAGADGSVTALWQEETATAVQLRTAVLPAGATRFSAPVTITQAPGIRDIHLAANASGKTVAIWDQGSAAHSNVYASERPNATGGWSPAARLDDAGASTQADSPQALVAEDGAVTAVWLEHTDSGSAAKTSELPAAGAGWTAPTAFSSPMPGAVTYQLATGAHGGLALVWTQAIPGSSDWRVALNFSQLQPGSSTWSPVETIATEVMQNEVPAPLFGPNGDVTLVWSDYRDVWGVRTATRSAATGAWSPTATLSSDVVAERLEAVISADGTVHTAWAQPTGPGDTPHVFVTASRTNGTWTGLKQLSTNTVGDSDGSITVGGPDNRPTVVWAEYHKYTLFTATTGPRPAPPIWRDFNSDGKPDLLARDANGTLWLYPGAGNGAFGDRRSLGGGWNAMPRITSVGDLNDDGHNDLLTVDNGGTLWMYPGKGDGKFGDRVNLGGGWNSMSALVGVGDLNGDGKADLLARDTSGILWTYPGNGTGAFGDRLKLGGGWNGMSALVGAGDLNGDGKADLLARDESGTLWTYPGAGTGAFGDRLKLGGGWNGMSALVGAGDLNGDGKADLLARDTSGILWTYPGNGTGAFGDRLKLGGGWNGYTSLS